MIKNMPKWMPLMIFLSSIFACNGINSPNKQVLSIKKPTRNSSQFKEVDIRSCAATISSTDNYALEIQTKYINDSDYLRNGWMGALNEVVISQQLIFKHNGDTITTKLFDVRSRLITKNNEKERVLDNVIVHIALINGTHGSFYKISGYGGCNNCTDYVGYFSLDGKLLYKNYTSNVDGYHESFGDYEKVWKKYGVSKSRENKRSLKSLTVFPPQDIGLTTNSYLL